MEQLFVLKTFHVGCSKLKPEPPRMWKFIIYNYVSQNVKIKFILLVDLWNIRDDDDDMMEI